jgi:protein-disulfide isomerase
VNRVLAAAALLRTWRTLAALALVVATTVPTVLRAAEVEVSAEPAMTRGPAAAPVTIIEFSDYQ